MVTPANIPARPERVGASPFADVVQTEWNVARVRAALRDHASGMLMDSATLCDAMLGDERIAADLRMRVGAVFGCPFRLDPAPDGDKRRASTVARDLAAVWPRIFPDATLRALCRWAVLAGIGFASVGWDTSAGVWTPSVEVWHPQHLMWDAARAVFLGQSTKGPVVVETGAGAWLMLAPSGHRAWIDGAVRGLAIPWLMRQHGRRDWARWCEKHGFPITAGELPIETQQSEKDAFLSDLRRLGSEGVVLLPKDSAGRGFNLRMIEPALADGWKGFEAALEHCNVSIAVALLGQASNAQEGGSYAKATALEGLRRDLLEGDAKALSDAIRDHVLRPWAQWNYGDAELAPIPVWDTAEPEDAKLLAETAKTMGDSLATWSTAAAAQGLDVDVEALGLRFNVPLRKATPKPDPVPPAPPKLHRLDARPERASIEGQVYIDGVFDRAMGHAAPALDAGVLGAVRKALRAAESYEALRAELVTILRDVDDSAAQELIFGAVMCCAAAGAFSAQGDGG